MRLSLPYNKNLKERARELRKAGNPAEILLWKEIKNRKLNGLNFNRQLNIWQYIVDFYCDKINTVIEIDGSSHDDKEEYDKERDAFLESYGIKVIHISHNEIMNNLNGVMLKLRNELKQP